MSDDRAEIRLGARGGDELVRLADDLRGSWTKAASSIGESWNGVGGRINCAVVGALRTVGGQFAQFGQDAIRVATLAHNITLAGAVESARQFDDTLGRLVVSKGVALADLRGRLEGTSKGILVGEPEIAAEAKALGNLTGDFRGALDAMRGPPPPRSSRCSVSRPARTATRWAASGARSTAG